MSVGYGVLDGDDVSRSANGLEGRAEENCVVVDPEAARLVANGCDGGEDLPPRGGCIGLVLEEDSDDGRRGVAYGVVDGAVAREVGNGRRTPDVRRRRLWNA